MALSIDQIVRLYRFEGTARYGMEAVARATPGWDHYRRLLERLELRPERAAGGGERAVAALLR